MLCHFPSGRKAKTLLQRGGPHAGCLGFSGSNLLCGAKSSGQLLVWDVTQSSQLAEEFNVHRVSAQCSWCLDAASTVCGSSMGVRRTVFAVGGLSPAQQHKHSTAVQAGK